MPIWNRLRELLRFAVAVNGEDPDDMPARIRPSRRTAAVTVERALSLSTFYRGVQIHATAASQLAIDVERTGAPIETPALVLRPDLDMTRSAWVEYTVVSLYSDGNAFWWITRNALGVVVNLRPLDPNEVSVHIERAATGADKVTYGYRGGEYTSREIKHLQLVRVPGMRRGLGPIQAAQIEVNGALDARDYGAMWLSDSAMPDGVLTTDQELAPGDADKYRHVWYGRNQDGTARDADDRDMRERLRVLGKGLSYAPVLLKPSDIQFLETQQYTTVQMARLIAAPASIMLVATEGTSQTYTNVEQEWIGYVRFGLMKALREIEEALSELLPGKQTARFKIDALLRSDTKTRYEAHNIALGKWSTADEIRALEGQAPLTAEQRAELATYAKTTTPTKEPA